MNPPCLRRRQSPPGAAATTPRVGERRTRSDAAPLRRGSTPPLPPFPSPAARFLLAADSETFGGKGVFLDSFYHNILCISTPGLESANTANQTWPKGRAFDVPTHHVKSPGMWLNGPVASSMRASPTWPIKVSAC
jgi:hypothetical protein